ncbi:MAG: hypothetical protein DU429_04150 [Candidatus Tokpelaia sp.]|uniref:EamA family transporter n=1 Tax=Candidatus Tokpelaia sp. TaxID=2233777 RepID=UPI00123B639E|nr:EamA family transporter [Candidatus Tokpelaia sp.]KAA6204975.1 MAG: hypothetical protein DU430_06225 [Candidatus Tokpelaia sp.]KAA6207043.1 MAG: hypothetical protein DU429_04150 [Candidatus Tokpelaia sp.]KAA6405417.1 hypothetical protein DPQ22_04990 [Candidatus Tokpelaia sp.]
MSNLVFWLWFGNVFFDTIGQLAFKAAAIAPENKLAAEGGGGLVAYWCGLVRRPALWLGIFSYVAEFLLWLAFLTLVPLSEGVLLGSVNIIVIMILGRLFFHESLTPLRLIGIGLVALGVAVVGAF